MSKLMITLFMGALFGSSGVALAVEAQPMEESTHPNSVNDVPVENARQEPDRNRGASSRSGSMEYNDREYLERWSESNTGSTGSAGGRGTNNPNSNSDVSGGDQIDAGTAGTGDKVEKMKQKPNKE